VRRRALIATVTAAAALTAAAPAPAATVQAMVVGREGVLRTVRPVTLERRTVHVRHRRCAVGARTPLSVLAGMRLRLRISDQGACGPKPRDAAGLYVFQVGSERAKGRAGWVYKVGRRAGTAGAADPAGPFGTGRGLRAGQRVLWFWCRLGASGGCQRTLEVAPQRAGAAPGDTLAVTVRGYDDAGAGVPVAGATVRLGSAKATTGADGAAVLTVPAASGRRLRLTAERDGMVRSFPREVAVR
jgi:hypothetical protein